MMRPVHLLCVTALAIGVISSIASIAGAEDAAQNYQMFCALCHGPKGAGDGPGAITLAIKPRNFTDCDRMRKVSEQEAFEVIRDGGAAAKLSPDMPPWRDSFSEEETHALVSYIKGFCNDNQGGRITEVRKH